MLEASSITAEDSQNLFYSQISAKAYIHWQTMARRRGGIPRRRDLDPAEIPRLLPHLFIVERVAESGRYFFRLSGTAIREIMGFENTNNHLDELLRGEDLKTVSQMFTQVMDEGVCIRSIEGLTYSDRSFVRVEILRLPLKGNDGDSRFVLGCLSQVESDCRPGAGGTVKDKQVIQIENDILPRRSF